MKDFGAKGDGTTDDTDALQRALDVSQERARVCYLPGGTYAVSRPLVTPSLTRKDGFFTLRADGTAILKATARMSAVLTTKPSFSVVLEGLRIDANHLAEHGLHLFHVGGHGSVVRQVRVGNATSHGVLAQECQALAIVNVSSSWNDGDGLRFEGCNASLAVAIGGLTSKGDGIVVTGRGVFTGGMGLRAIHAEQNAGNGVTIDATGSPVSIDGGWIEGNGRDGVRVAANGVVLRNLQILGGGGGENWAIHVLQGFRGSSIADNYFQAGSGDTTYAAVRLEEPPRVGEVGANFRRRVGTAVEPLVGPPVIGRPPGTMVSAGKDVLDGGDMEGDATWSGEGIETVTDKFHAGEHALLVTGVAPATRSLTLQPGRRYRVSAWLWVAEGEGDLIVNGGRGVTQGKARTKPADVWVERSITMTAYGSRGFVRLAANGRGARVYFDDVRVVELPD